MKKLKADRSQGMLVIIGGTSYFLPVCYPTILKNQDIKN
jgi:hypothetical protein